MNNKITINIDFIKKFVTEDELNGIFSEIERINRQLEERKGPGSEFLGWLDLPNRTIESYAGFQELVTEIRQEADVFLVIGIGGSYLGARAVVEALEPGLDEKGPMNPEIIFAGYNIDSVYMTKLLEYLKTKSVYVNVISKSGTTTEPGIAFRVVKAMMEKVYGKDEARKRIIATTDEKKGALRKMAEEEGYRTFTIPADVGGRFSVLTPVGLLPIAVSGNYAETLLDGALNMKEILQNSSYDVNIANLYAAIRYLLYKKGKSIEILSNFDQKLVYFAEWWKQLFGESEGKNGKGIFPASANFTTDLHSLGQYIQEGRRDLLETFLIVKKIQDHIMVPEDEKNLDGLNYLAGKTYHEINLKAHQGTAEAHRDGGVPNMTIYLPEINAYWLGSLIFMFEKAVAISGYLLGVNPFNQPGVEAYKTNMFKLLGKPGF
ncbi:glucose-6-phosphate isomerase [candidate division KSB1 bacterium 4484_87]|nr:MAG: glucose-6-phosphate isomerase [candidate division KSB1 bacterium 4484_87]